MQDYANCHRFLKAYFSTKFQPGRQQNWTQENLAEAASTVKYQRAQTIDTGPKDQGAPNDV